VSSDFRTPGNLRVKVYCYWKLIVNFWKNVVCFLHYFRKLANCFRTSGNLTTQVRKMEEHKSPTLGKKSTTAQAKTWVQTEKSSHEKWAALISQKPRAAQLLHILVAKMGHQNALVISQKSLAELMGVTDRTVRSSVKALEEKKWIQVVKMNGPGTVAAYVVNSRVAWGDKRSQMNSLSTFTAEVVASRDDQSPETLSNRPLVAIPTMYPGQSQLPAGEGLEPPSQPSFEGMEPDLPAIVRDPDGNEWKVDPQTGEVLGLVESE